MCGIRRARTSHADPDGPAKRSDVEWKDGQKVLLPKASVTVLTGKVSGIVKAARTRRGLQFTQHPAHAANPERRNSDNLRLAFPHLENDRGNS